MRAFSVHENARFVNDALFKPLLSEGERLACGGYILGSCDYSFEVSELKPLASA